MYRLIIICLLALVSCTKKEAKENTPIQECYSERMSPEIDFIELESKSSDGTISFIDINKSIEFVSDMTNGRNYLRFKDSIIDIRLDGFSKEHSIEIVNISSINHSKGSYYFIETTISNYFQSPLYQLIYVTENNILQELINPIDEITHSVIIKDSSCFLINNIDNYNQYSEDSTYRSSILTLEETSFNEVVDSVRVKKVNSFLYIDTCQLNDLKLTGSTSPLNSSIQTPAGSPIETPEIN